jgi:hypothetical protein
MSEAVSEAVAPEALGEERVEAEPAALGEGGDRELPFELEVGQLLNGPQTQRSRALCRDFGGGFHASSLVARRPARIREIADGRQ